MPATRNLWKICAHIYIWIGLSAISAPAFAGPIDRTYSVSGYLAPSAQMDSIGFWGAYGGSIPPSAWSAGDVLLGSFNHSGPNPNWFPGGSFKDIVYENFA